MLQRKEKHIRRNRF